MTDMFSPERMEAYTRLWPEYRPYAQLFGEYYKSFRDAFIDAGAGRIQLGSVEVLLAYSGGRAMATFRDGTQQVTLVGDATGTDPRFGLHTYDGHITDAGAILKKAVTGATPSAISFQPDASVNII